MMFALQANDVGVANDDAVAYDVCFAHFLANIASYRAKREASLAKLFLLHHICEANTSLKNDLVCDKILYKVV